MVAQMDKEGFGSCTNTGACEAECPKGISISNIARLNREFIGAGFTSEGSNFVLQDDTVSNSRLVAGRLCCFMPVSDARRRC